MKIGQRTLSKSFAMTKDHLAALSNGPQKVVGEAAIKISEKIQPEICNKPLITKALDRFI